ncbi:MAG: TolC family protein [Bacteroidales bacterium]|jgi:outer membrane protein TolC|nr:TolC family protein [Bacteroidales bacterium]
MKKLLLVIIIAVLFTTGVTPQTLITLKECYELATANNALSSEKEAYSSIAEIKDENLLKSWLPTLDINASALYNSDIVDFSDAMAAVPAMSSVFHSMPKDQYKITLDINQTFYDGGAIKNARAMEQAELKLNEKQVEIDEYKIRGEINAYYFNIILLGRQKEILSNYLQLMEKRMNAMESAITNGVKLKHDMDIIKSEKISIEQQMAEIESKKKALMKIMSDMTGTEITDLTSFAVPEPEYRNDEELTRHELQMFDLKREQLSAAMKMTQTKRLPKAFGFATAGYGNPPGQNFLEDSFDTYYIIGAGIKWNIFDWNKTKNEKQVIAIQQGIIENRKTDMTDNIRRMLETKMSEINSLEEMIKSDEELLELRKRISRTAESQYDNGTITAAEYMAELNAEKNAAVNSDIHRLKLALAGVEYMNLSGRDIE